MKISNEAKIGITIVLAILIFLFGISYLTEYDFRKKGYVFYTKFDNVNGLNEGDPISVTGVKIGKVNRINLNNNGVFVELWINKDVGLPMDSKISIKSISFLGEKYISISPGELVNNVSGGDTLKGVYEKDLIDMAPNVEHLLNEINSVTENFKLALSDSARMNLHQSLFNIKKITNDLQTILNSEKGEIDEIISKAKESSDMINKTIASNQGNVNSAIKDFTNYSKKLGIVIDNLESTTTSSKKLLSKIENSEGSLGKIVNDEYMYKSIDSLVTNINNLVDDFKKNPKKYIKVSIF